MSDTDYIKKIEDYIGEYDDRVIKNTVKLNSCNEELQKINNYLKKEEEKLQVLINERDNYQGWARPAIKIILTIIMYLSITMANIIPFTFFYDNMINSLNVYIILLNGMGMLATGSIISMVVFRIGQKLINKALKMYDNDTKKTKEYKQIEKMISDKNRTINGLKKIKSNIEQEVSILENKNTGYQSTLREFNDLLNYLSIDIDSLLNNNEDNSKKKIKRKYHF